MHEHTVQIATPDGVMPVEMFHPSHEDTYPGIVFYMDVFGLRDELRDMCRRFAVAGYAVALPSIYYRAGGPSFPPSNGPHDPVPEEARRLNLATSQAMSASDTRALLDSPQAFEVEIPIWGTVGYCMGGRHALAAAALNPDRISAAASLHGGLMINNTELSCEKLFERIDGEIYLGFAEDDPVCSDADQAILAEALARSGKGRVEHYRAHHGWTFPTRFSHTPEAADRTWEDLFQLFRTNLWGAL